MKYLVKSLIIFCISFSSFITYAGGDLGGGGLKSPKKKMVLTKKQKKQMAKARTAAEQKAIWLDSLTIADEEMIYDAVFREMIQPQINPVAEE